MSRSSLSPSSSLFVSSSRRTLAQRLRARLGRRRGFDKRLASMSMRAPGTLPPATGTRAACSSYVRPGSVPVGPLGATVTGPPPYQYKFNSIAPGSSGSATAAPGASGAPPEPAGFIEWAQREYPGSTWRKIASIDNARLELNGFGFKPWDDAA